MKYLKSARKYIFRFFEKKVKMNKLLKAITERQLKGFEAVIVIYKDETAKYFTIQSWLIFRQGIVDNLYKKRLCKIHFVTRIQFISNQSDK